MKRTHLIAVLAGIVAVAVFAADASAMYHPTLGRFTSRDPGPGSTMRIGAGGPAVGGGFVPRDPTGSNQYADGMNLYQYVRSDPPSHVDPTGLNAPRMPFVGERRIDYVGGFLDGGGESECVGFEEVAYTAMIDVDDPRARHIWETEIREATTAADAEVIQHLKILLPAGSLFDPEHPGHTTFHPQKCTCEDSCSLLSAKIGALTLMIVRHSLFDAINRTNRHTEEIRNMLSQLGNCKKIHKVKCTGSIPKIIPVKVTKRVPIWRRVPSPLERMFRRGLIPIPIPIPVRVPVPVPVVP